MDRPFVFVLELVLDRPTWFSRTIGFMAATHAIFFESVPCPRTALPAVIT